MKRFAMLLSLALVITAGAAFAVNADKHQMPMVKGEEVDLVGQLSCTACRFAHPDKPCAKQCCLSCIKAGDPALLTDAQGNMYILLNGELKKPLMNKERLGMAGGQIAVKGVLVKGQGVQVIFVETMKKA